jgi:hypothetical protein
MKGFTFKTSACVVSEDTSKLKQPGPGFYSTT